MLILTMLIAGCTLGKKENLFDAFADQEVVAIYLSQYNLDSVPPEIGRLNRARSLSIAMDSTTGWKIYPPLSALRKMTEKPPFRNLPDEIADLTNLGKLSLVGLGLKTLPDDFGKLENLDSLDLTLNKLTISNEIEKLRKLRKLKYLALSGNNVDTTDIIELKRTNDNLIIDSGLDKENAL